MTFGKQNEQIFLGREFGRHRDYSESTAVSIDDEVRKLINIGYERAKRILTENRDAVIRIAESLLVRESLDAAEIRLLIAGETLKERLSPKIETKPEDMTPASAKSVRPLPIPPQEKPVPA
jgi:cell division protease FtsH